MEENKDYNPSQYEDDDRMEAPKSAKSIRGYQTIIVILAVILAALSILYFNIHRQQQEEYDLLLVDRDSIKSNLSHLMEDFDNLQISNDSISQSLGLERSRADSLMERLTKERSWSYAKIKKYEKEIGTMRTIMRGYLRQIDSLNTLNKNLIKENVSYRSGRGEGFGAEHQGTSGCGDPRTGHPARAAQRARQGGVAREERLAPARRIHAGGQRPGRAGRTDGLRAHHLARRVRAVQCIGGDLRVRGRAADLHRFARRRLPE